ncbi:rubrerythrin [Methanosarcina barkeri CM1]|uniref:Rubrerythrin n=1 Tax=Methanosarcina barkeri CM1 TaxID=796385 RepID=A0A0G3CEX4_METBA|nr:rubrerythrin [Methanosarcina barkeri CM1]
MSNFNFIYLIFINYFIEAVISNRKKHYSCPFILYRNTLRRGGNLLSEALVDLEKTRPEDLEKEILRAAMIAELDAINIYEQMANLAKSEEIRKVLLDIAREEKIHVAMFETVLLHTDKEFLKIYSDYALARSKK